VLLEKLYEIGKLLIIGDFGFRFSKGVSGISLISSIVEVKPNDWA
jgi:hypothetical protein